MDKYFDFKELKKGILVVLIYFILPYFISPLLISILTPNFYKTHYFLYVLICYTILASIFIAIYHKDLKKDFLDMKKKGKEHLKKATTYWLRGFFIMWVSSIIINLLNIVENTNQQENINLLQQVPLLEFILACLFAPIIEELVFRKSLRKGIKNKYLYVTITGISFGFLHVATSLSDISTILYLIPYSALGIAFGYIYYETNNILPSMIVHGTHNFLCLFIQVLGGLLK